MGWGRQFGTSMFRCEALQFRRHNDQSARDQNQRNLERHKKTVRAADWELSADKVMIFYR